MASCEEEEKVRLSQPKLALLIFPALDIYATLVIAVFEG
jgi:hypothetical protein